jgi:hypothetical protein
MNKKILLLPLVALLLSACTMNNSSSNETSTSIDTSESSITLSETSTSETESSTSSAPELVTLSNITAIKELALTYKDLVNEQKVYTSTNVKATFTAQLLAVHDCITSSAGYTAQYKALVANETGSIFVALGKTAYDYVEGYLQKQDVYTFTGFVGIYSGEPEVVMDINTKPIWQEGVTLDYSLNSLTDSVKSINEAYSVIDGFFADNSYSINNKGIAGSADLINIDLKYLSKIENEVALFTDGVNVLQAHGHSYINNDMTEGNVYNVIAAVIMFNFKPELKFISAEAIDKTIDLSFENASEITNNEVYSLSYDIEHPNYTSNKNYASSFIQIYHYEGYVNSYLKGDRDNVVFDMTRKSAYTSITSATTAKALFANNSNCEELYSDSDFNNCPFVSFLGEDIEVEFYFTLYLLNTSHYWQIQVLEDTISQVL